MGQTFDNSGRGEQNIAQGDEAIGKQVNINQDMKGDSNIVAGSGNISIEHYHANRWWAESVDFLIFLDILFSHYETVYRNQLSALRS